MLSIENLSDENWSKINTLMHLILRWVDAIIFKRVIIM